MEWSGNAQTNVWFLLSPLYLHLSVTHPSTAIRSASIVNKRSWPSALNHLDSGMTRGVYKMATLDPYSGLRAGWAWTSGTVTVADGSTLSIL